MDIGQSVLNYLFPDWNGFAMVEVSNIKLKLIMFFMDTYERSSTAPWQLEGLRLGRGHFVSVFLFSVHAERFSEQAGQSHRS